MGVCRIAPATTASPWSSFLKNFHLMLGSIYALVASVWKVGKFTPASAFPGRPTTNRGLYRYVRDPRSGPGAWGRKSNSAYAFPLSTVSVDGMLKIVD